MSIDFEKYWELALNRLVQGYPQQYLTPESDLGKVLTKYTFQLYFLN